MKIQVGTIGLVLATMAVTTPLASSQRLLALDHQSIAHRVHPGNCALLGSCLPPAHMPPAGGGHGGIAYDRFKKTTWATNGDFLTRSRPMCVLKDAYPVPNLVGPLAVGPDGHFLNGLAIRPSEKMLFFVTYAAVGEVPTPDSTGGALDVGQSVYVPGPYPLTYPLTGVEYDKTNDTLWVIDSQYNIVNMERPSNGGLVLSGFSLPTACGLPTPMIEGIALDTKKQVPGHPQGVLIISDSSNRLFKVDRLGVLIGCCVVPPAPAGFSAFAGLAWKPKGTAHDQLRVQ